jgi:hypothetical protein
MNKAVCTELHRTSQVQSQVQLSACVCATPNWGAPHSLCIEYELSAVHFGLRRTVNANERIASWM